MAIATPTGPGALGIVRVSGPMAIEAVNDIFSRDLLTQPANTVVFGRIRDKEETIDEALVSVFRAPNSYTGEDLVEISCHGSPYILARTTQLLLENGAVAASPGEFTQRAFLNGKLDLSQAEAVADLIASESAAGHRIAMQQLRGGFSNDLAVLREKLIHFASLIELELDFAEEDVEFANRDEFKQLIREILDKVMVLIDSFKWGNVLKQGVPVVIAGKPNAGKSTLLNALLKEEKAIVSEIPGTTRDSIEDEIVLEGIRFRFIDTAGLRETTDTIEAIGVERSMAKLKTASIVLYLYDLGETSVQAAERELEKIQREMPDGDASFLLVGNKVDRADKPVTETKETQLFISAKTGEGISQLTDRLLNIAGADKLQSGMTVVTNTRHLSALQRVRESLEKALEGTESGISNDFIAMDIRQALHYIGEITGQVSTDDLLGNIFSRFCIGK